MSGPPAPGTPAPSAPPPGPCAPGPAPVPDLLVGVGARRGASAAEVLGLVRRTLGEAGWGTEAVLALATAAGKATEPGLVAAAAELRVPLLAFDPARLAAVAVPSPSATVRAAIGAPGVAEAAALLAAGPAGGELLVGKRKSTPPGGGSAMVTCAVARRRTGPARHLAEPLPGPGSGG